MCNRTAVIITGQLRSLDENKKYLNEIAIFFDVFICTSKGGSENLEKLENVKQVFFIDDNVKENEEERSNLSIEEGSKLLQWQKLRYVVKKIENYERENNFQYKQFIKLRTDLLFTDAFIEDIKNFKGNDNTIYMFTDLYFAAKRNEFFVLSSFYEHRELYYNNFLLDSVDLTDFHKHDLAAAKFLWLQYESLIFEKIIFFIKNREEFKDEYEVAFLEQLEHFKLIKKSPLKMCSRPNWDSLLFASEALFLHFILSKKFIVQPLTNTHVTLHDNRFFDVELFLSNYGSMNYRAISYSLKTIDTSKRMGVLKAMCLLGRRQSKVKLMMMLFYFSFINFKYIYFFIQLLFGKLLLKIKKVLRFFY
jgi:hypothetical protein